MKKFTLAILLYFCFVLIFPANAKDIGKIKDINITGLNDSNVFDVKSNKDLPLQLCQSEDIEKTSLNTDENSDGEVVLSGNKKSANKKNDAKTEVAQNGIILIEPEPENNNISNNDFMPLSLQATSLPSLNEYRMVAPQNSLKTVKAQLPPATSLNVYSNNQPEDNNLSKGKRLLTQASSVESDEVIEFGDNSGATTTVETDNTTLKTVKKPPVTAKKNLVGSIFSWIKKHVILSVIIGIALLVVFFIIASTILYLISTKMHGAGTMQMPSSEHPEGGAPASGQIVDNEPVDFIPPRHDTNTQSVSDAINKVINIRNKMD